MASLHRYILLWLSVAAVCTFATEVGSEVELELVFTEEPQDVIVLRGEPFVFNCSAISVTDNRPVNITWRRDGDLVHDARRYVLPNGSLFFERIVRKKHGRGDEGDYECLARKNGEVIVSRSASLTIAGIERVESAPTQDAVVGELVRRPCNLKADPPGTLTWQKDKQDLPPDSRYTILDSGVLQIEGVIEADTGQYRCKITNIAASKFSREDELIIQRPEAPPGRKPPEMLLPAQHVTKKVGETVTLECAASGLPIPSLTWSFQNGTAVNGPRVEIVGHGNLRIRNLEGRDSSMYKCTATNPDNPAQVGSVLTRVIVAEPPTVVESTPSMENQLSDTVRINCAFKGSPTPKITAFKDGVYKGTTTTDPAEHMWVITYLDNTHKGYYQCRAENDAGQVTTTMRLKIKPSILTPDKPQNVRAVVKGPTTLSVEWDPVPPKNGIKVHGYSVHYCNVADQLELQAVTLEKTSIELKQLQPYSNISIYVLAYNSQSASSRSDLIYQLIGEDVPTAGPAVTLCPIGASSLKVTWEKLPIQKARGVITEYDIYYREQQAKGSIRVETVQGDVHEYTLSGLEPNKAYNVRVMAKTAKGFPQLTDDEWPWRTAFTNSQHDALEPPDMQVYALNQTAVQVIWRPTSPDHGGTAGYRLDVLTARNVRLKRLLFTPEQLQDTITGLEPDSLYKISLRCLGNIGQDKQEGEPTVRNVKTLKIGEAGVQPSSPPPPQELDAFAINQTAVRVEWKRPKYTPGISSYTLRYKPVQSDLAKAGPNATFVKHHILNDNETLEKMIGGLKPYTLYEFSIRTHKTSSFGAFSNAIRCKTDEGLPTAPRNVQYTLRAPGRVELTWEPPRRPNGIITQYLIYYRPDKPDEPWATQKQSSESLIAEVDELELGVDFVFYLKAKTSVGKGPASNEVRVRTQNPYPPDNSPRGRHAIQERRNYIIIGVSISGFCVIITIVIIIFRNRCCTPPANIRNVQNTSPNNTLPIHFNGTYMPHSNGNRCNCNSTNQTLDTFTPMLPMLVENENSDSKGGSGLNGMPGLRVQCMPNGQVETLLAGQDIHSNRPQKTSGLMRNGRSNNTVALTLAEGRPDISREHPAPGDTPRGDSPRTGDAEDGDPEDDEDGSAQSSHSGTSASTASRASPPRWPNGWAKAVPFSEGTEMYRFSSGAPEAEEPAHKQQTTALTAPSSRTDCEEGDCDTDAVAEETESSRLLSHHPQPHRHHTTQPSQPQPSQSTHHRSSLTEYASSPPQSRYEESGTTGLTPSDGDTSGTPLLYVSVQPTRHGSSHLQAPSESPHA